MEAPEALSTAAQIAVALAGFAGVVVAFRSGSVYEWSEIDKFRLRLLLTNSIFPLAFSVFGLWLLTIKPPPEAIWRWCSAFALLFLLPFSVLSLRTTRSLDPDEFKGLSKAIFYLMFVLGIATILMQLYNATVLNTFWAFYFAIIVQLMGAMLQFARLILLPPYRRPDT